MAEEKIIDISQIRHDKRNFNKGTDEGKEMMEKSFKEHGAGRSILLDKDGNIIAGNKSTSAARKAGIKKVRVIETDGTELIAVKRTDIDIDSAEGRRLALADNATTQANLVFDHQELEACMLECDLDPNEWGVPILPPEPEGEHEYQVIVDVDSEKEQEKLYNRLTKQGYECKILGMM